MKTTTLGIAIGTAIAALGLAITAVPKPRQVVFIGTTMVEAVSSSIAVTPTVPAVITTTDRTITEVAVLLQVSIVPVLAVTTVVVDASITDPSIVSKSSHFTPSALAGFSIERNSSDQPG